MMLREWESDREAELENALEFEGLSVDGEEEFEIGTTTLGQYEVIGPDSRILTTTTTAAPFRYICHLEYNRQALCTGTLIGPRTILTAGHCLARRSPHLLRVIPGRNGTLEPLPATQATAFRLAPGFRSVSPTDYGIIHLRDPIGSRVGYWTRTYSRRPVDPTGTSISATGLPLAAGVLQVNVAGYPGDKCMAVARRRVCGTRMFRAYDRTARLRGGILHYVNDTFGGMSGSPVWVRRHPSMGGRVLVAIHIAGDDPATPGVANRGVRITPPILRWIAANTI
jgi:glutamyl endopeptidase